MSPTYRAADARYPRALAASVLITGLATAAHALAGGRVPGPGFLLTFASIVLGSCLARSRRLVPLPVLVVLVGGAQLALHTLLETAPLPAAQADMAGMPGMPAMDVSSHPSMVGAAMLWAHVVAALVTAIVLLAQDALVARVLGWWARPQVPLIIGGPRQVLMPEHVASVHRSRLLAVSPRRGPPLLPAAAP